jgi:hypothetical protein
VSSHKVSLSKLVKSDNVGLVCDKKSRETKRKFLADKDSNLSSQTKTCFTQKIGVSVRFAFIARLNKCHPYEIMVVHKLERTDCCWLCRIARVPQMLFITSGHVNMQNI